MFRITSLRVMGLWLLLIASFIGYFEFFRSHSIFISVPAIVSLLMLIVSFAFGLFLIRYLAKTLHFCYLWLRADGQGIEVVHLDFNTPIPDHLLDSAKEIENLGLKRLGVKKVTVNGNNNRIWIWIDNTKTIVAQLLETNTQEPRVGFASEYHDGFSIETVYKWEITINTDRVMLHNLDSSISETFNFHTHLYDEQIGEHGQPKVVLTLADTDSDVPQRKREMRQFYVSLIRRFIPVVLFFGTVTLAFLATGILLQTATTGIAFFSCMIIMGFSFTLIDYQAVDESFKPINERKSRKAVEA